jgi:hypothetical protein
VIAVTYGGEFTGDDDARLEVGVMLFSPPFLCFRKCKEP